MCVDFSVTLSLISAEHQLRSLSVPAVCSPAVITVCPLMAFFIRPGESVMPLTAGADSLYPGPSPLSTREQGLFWTVGAEGPLLPLSPSVPAATLLLGSQPQPRPPGWSRTRAAPPADFRPLLPPCSACDRRAHGRYSPRSALRLSLPQPRAGRTLRKVTSPHLRLFPKSAVTSRLHPKPV